MVNLVIYALLNLAAAIEEAIGSAAWRPTFRVPWTVAAAGFALCAAMMVLIGDMLLGWGTPDPALSGMEAYFSKYLTVSDARIFWSALLGLVGIPIEVLSYFGVYRLMADKTPKHAHAYRAGIFGMLTFGALVHVICCAIPFYYKKMYALAPNSAVSEDRKSVV